MAADGRAALGPPLPGMIFPGPTQGRPGARVETDEKCLVSTS